MTTLGSGKYLQWSTTNNIHQGETLLLTIIVDTNNVDYLNSTFQAANVDLELMRKIAAILSEFNDGRDWDNGDGHNWEIGNWDRTDLYDKSWYKSCSPKSLYIDTGLLTEEEVETFTNYLPYSDCGLHTIVAIRLIEIVEVLL